MDKKKKSKTVDIKMIGSPNTELTNIDQINISRLGENFYITGIQLDPDGLLMAFQDKGTEVNMLEKRVFVLNKTSFQRFLAQLENFKSNLISDGVLKNE